MEGKRKVGRQRIPAEYHKREEQVKKATLNTKLEPINNASSAVDIGPGKVNMMMIGDLQAAMDTRHQQPSMTPFVDKNSLPYSTSLRTLAQKSVSVLAGKEDGMKSANSVYGKRSNLIAGTS